MNGTEDIVVELGSTELSVLLDADSSVNIDIGKPGLSLIMDYSGIPGPQGPPGPSIQWTSVRRSDELTPYAYALAISIAGWRIRRWTAATKVISVATGTDADDAETAWTARATQVYS